MLLFQRSISFCSISCCFLCFFFLLFCWGFFVCLFLFCVGGRRFLFCMFVCLRELDSGCGVCLCVYVNGEGGGGLSQEMPIGSPFILLDLGEV